VIGEETRTVEIVFPNDTNSHHNLFGGHALSMMDRLAFIVASRYARRNMVTVASDKVEFHHPVKLGDVVELVAKIVRVGRTSVAVDIDMHSENLLTGERELCTTAEFVMVALDEAGEPTPVPQPEA
jgi:acyl-CoA hydrolase